jgi:hypothetical protein
VGGNNMGDAKKRIAQKEFRSGTYPCVYCGEFKSSALMTVDHMPSRGAFDNRQRPKELEFPACTDCNSATRDLDNIIGWIGRMFPDPKTNDQKAELGRLTKTVKSRYPEVATSLQKAQSQLVNVNGVWRPLPGTIIRFEGEYVDAVMRQFGLKLGLAMHWHETKHVVPENGVVEVFWFSNFQHVTGEFPEALFRIFPKPRSLQQGSFSTKGQFSFSSAVDDQRSMSAHICAFRYSFSVLALVSEKPTDGSPEIRPMHRADLRRSYPFGLPRLTPLELAVLRARQINPNL